ncbi:MAG: carbon-nitrogen hydrolase family protein [Chitinophagaceae bacterium]|nr:carbon-nitrogen hydrolase family protein [Chitinophagaceae bacterium]
MKEVKIAMVQMLVKGNDIAANLANAESCLQAAAANGADIAVLPECMDIGWTHPGSREHAGTIPGGEVFGRLSAAAAKWKIFVCSGLTERDNGKVYNTAVLIDSNGHLLLKHRKINELDIGKPYYATGDRINIVDTAFGRLGVMICADAIVEDRSIATALARMEPDIILSPCAWAVPPGYDNDIQPYGDLWRDAYMPIAEKFSTYIIGVSNTGHMEAGPWKGWDCIGASIAVDNTGKQMQQLPFGVTAETIVYVHCLVK